MDGSAKSCVPMKMRANPMNCLRQVPKVILTSRDSSGKNHALATTFCCNCSLFPPMIFISVDKSNAIFRSIVESGCFIANLVGNRSKEIYSYFESQGERDRDGKVNAGMWYQDGRKVNAPYLSVCPVNIECRILYSRNLDSHEVFVGQVEYAHADAELVDNSGNIDFSQIDFLS